MGITIQAVKNKLFCVFKNSLGKETRSDLSTLLILGEDRDRILKIILEPISLMRPTTIHSHMPRLRLLGETLTYLKIKKPPKNPEDWQTVVQDIHRYILTRLNSRASLLTRMAVEWQTIRSYLNSLVEAGIIPISTYLPPVREQLDSLDTSPYSARLLGQPPIETVNANFTTNKLICSISTSRTDADYLEELRDSLSQRRHILLETLTKHWNYIKTNMKFGKKLIKSIDWEFLHSQLKNHQSDAPHFHPAYPSSLEGLANYLAVIHYHHNGLAPSDDSYRSLDVELIPKMQTFGFIPKISKELGTPKSPYTEGNGSNRNTLLWWQSKISHFDVSVITALLIMLEPSWTPQSIMLSKISNRNGKQYLDLTDSGACFEIAKHRAKKMKHAKLDPLVHEIISTLIKASKSDRRKLLSQNDPKASLLFLPCGFSGITYPIPSGASRFLSGSNTPKNHLWVGLLYPELVNYGLTSKTMSFAKIRNTEGVLEWFRTKSIRAVARKLGNTEKVVLEHYIPKALLNAWNTRMIRRFQNLWLSVAAANENFLLDVTDFGNLADLHAFLKDMLMLHGANDSPLSELLHRKFGAISGEVIDIKNNNAHLHIAISKAGLSALYSYQAAAIDIGLSNSVLDKNDEVTGLTPRHFISLADLLQSQLPLDKNPEYIMCHNEAILFASRSENRRRWASLMI